MRRTIGTEHLPNVLHQSVRLLPGGKMPAFLMLPLEDDVTQMPVPHARRRSDLLGEIREALYIDKTSLVKGFSQFLPQYVQLTYQLGLWYGPPSVCLPLTLEHLMIDVHAGRRSSTTIPIQAYPLTDLLIRPWVIICPDDQFLINPGQKRDGTIRKHGPDCLGPCPHHVKVVTTIVLIVLCSFEAGLLLGCVQVQHMRCEEAHEAQRRFRQRRRHGQDEVKVQC